MSVYPKIILVIIFHELLISTTSDTTLTNLQMDNTYLLFFLLVSLKIGNCSQHKLTGPLFYLILPFLKLL